MFKKFLVVFTSVLIVSLIIYLVINRNKETVIDLGNGWKSYSHEEIGVTVKVPIDAETVFEKKGDKKERPSVDFSKGPIYSIYSIDPVPNYSKQREIEKKRKDILKFKSEETNSDINKNERRFDKEFSVNGEIAFVYFFEEMNIKKNEHYFSIGSITIPGETRSSFISFHPLLFRLPENFYKQYPQLLEGGFSNEELEQRMQDHIEVIKDLIIDVGDL